MCSISGAMYPNESTRSLRKEIADKFNDTMIAAIDRGKDSYGAAVFYNLEPVKLVKDICAAKQINGLTEEGITMVINNNRAEPTTEFVKNKRSEDVQPFQNRHWVVAHNGTIANDKELAEKYNIQRKTTIDSDIIPGLLHSLVSSMYYGELDWKHIVRMLTLELVGSYAMAIVNDLYPNDIILMTNYKPLFLGYNKRKNYFIFTSLEEYMQKDTLEDRLTSDMQVTQISPYSAVHIHFGDVPVIEEVSIRKKVANKKAVIVCSGGLDSTVVAAHAIKLGYEVCLLHFLYSCRAEAKEKQAIHLIARKLNCKCEFIQTDIFKNDIGGSRLTGTKGDVADGESGAEFAHEWVPARNLIMLSIAVGWAESHKYDTIMLGNNLEESGAYPDNEMIFIQKLNEVLPFATQVDTHVNIVMPVGNMMKHEIVKYGLEINAPLDLCWSCYETEELHCGICGPCYMRKTAFDINHTPEVIKYKNSGGNKNASV